MTSRQRWWADLVALNTLDPRAYSRQVVQRSKTAGVEAATKVNVSATALHTAWQLSKLRRRWRSPRDRQLPDA